MSVSSVLHHSIICITVLSMILPCFGTECFDCIRRSERDLVISNLLSYTDQNHPQPMQRVIVDILTTDVYVGARNSLYHFNEKLRVQRIVSTGPELDNPKCLHPDYPCSHERTITDNDNKVLEIFPNMEPSQPPLLLTCGTLYQGLCQLQLVSDISRRTWIRPFNETVGFVSGNGSTVAFFAEGDNKQKAFYSASTYDGRPLNYSPASVSSKRLMRDKDGVWLKYTDKTNISFTGVNFKFKDSYKIEYITGFGFDNYAYFLTTQKVSVESEAFETRLGRVCMNDSQFFSYTEVPMKCQTGMGAYNLATAAHLGLASAQLKRTLKLDKIPDVLYVAFSKTIPDHGRHVDKSKGSVICSFPMSTVITSFNNATRDCFEAEPRASLLHHVTGQKLDCTKEPLKTYDDFCGSGINHYIAGMESICGGVRHRLSSQVTSLATVLQRGKSIAIAGTADGDVIKVDMDMIDHTLYVKNIAGDQEDKRIQSSNAFDPLFENIYFLVGNKIAKFPIGSCSVYTDCKSCLTKGDPLMCGWCGDHCAHHAECDRPDIFTTTSCSPVIYQILPMKGPTEGGTTIRIEGDNFGTYTGKGGVVDPKDIPELTITVAGVPCELVSWNNTDLSCKTQPVKELTLSGKVEVNVSDVTWTIGHFDINGSVVSRVDFTYVTPILYGIYPGKGPVSGGTNITFHGSSLDIGFNRVIYIAGIPCKQNHFQHDVAWCITEMLPNVTSDEKASEPLLAGTVEFIIDDVVIEIEDQIPAGLEFGHPISKSFKYLPDPEIYSILPEATTLSGIKNLTIKGKYLNSVESPRMVVNFASSATEETLHVMSDPCWSDDTSNGSILICPTPPLQSSAFHAPTERAPLVTHVSFLMDGVEKLRQLPKHEMELSKLLYYPDPEVYRLSEDDRTQKVYPDQKSLEIKGKNLNLALYKSDIQIFFDKSTMCPVVALTSETIVCSMRSIDQFIFTNTTKHTVMALIGSQEYQLGSVELSRSVLVPLLMKIGIPIVVFVIFSIVLFFILRRYRRRKKHPAFSVAFNSNPNTCGGGFVGRPAGNDYQDLPRRTATRQQSEGAEGTPDEAAVPIDEETIRLLESQNILVPRNYLTLGEIIGEGQFGCVYKGELILPSKEGRLDVAVKTLRRPGSRTAEHDTEAFLQEGLLMKDFHHENVLTLIGVCFDRNASPMVITPFMKHGDLLSFLRKEDSDPTLKELMTFGIQIASGMKYLADMKFVHRDLAARNCMLGDDQTVKVADFGLSRDVYERDYYTSENKTRLPIKWMAPESLGKGTYTSKSDVWSYAVVLWELMTRGVEPYPGVDNWDVMLYIKLGRRMPQPYYCPNMLYGIMLKCWNEDPKERPTFAELVKKVEEVVTKLELKYRQRRIGLNVTYVNYDPSQARLEPELVGT